VCTIDKFVYTPLLCCSFVLLFLFFVTVYFKLNFVLVFSILISIVYLRFFRNSFCKESKFFYDTSSDDCTRKVNY
jgi:hypothetical protein